MFLSKPFGFRKRAERSSCRPEEANCPHGPAGVFLREHGISFHPWAGYSGDAAIPEAASRWGETFAPPRDRTVSQCLSVRLTRLVPGRRGTFTGQCGQPLCPGEATSHRVGSQRRTVVGRCEGKRMVPPPRGFGRLGSVAYRPGRNVTPPELRLPGPSVTGRCRPMLAA